MTAEYWNNIQLQVFDLLAKTDDYELELTSLEADKLILTAQKVLLNEETFNKEMKTIENKISEVTLKLEAILGKINYIRRMSDMNFEINHN